MSKHIRRWQWLKLRADCAIYAYCNKCKFYYPAYKNIAPNGGIIMRPDVTALYPYCPYCGKKMSKPVDNINYIEYDFDTESFEQKQFKKYNFE